MVEHLDAYVRRRWRIADDDIQRVYGQSCEKLLGIALSACDLHRLDALDRGPQQPVNDELGYCIRHPDGKPERTAGRPPFECLEQFAACRENFGGISLDDPTDIGQDKRTSLPLKQTLSECRLERLDLCADRRL
jgi:hypothetical protein